MYNLKTHLLLLLMFYVSHVNFLWDVVSLFLSSVNSVKEKESLCVWEQPCDSWDHILITALT